jgi:flagellar motor switch protein FliN/FliY
MTIVADELLSQDEIDALLNDDVDVEELTDQEIDAMGEVGNISMGTSATTLYTLLGQKVSITTPKVTTSTMKTFTDNIDFPYVIIKIGYKTGIEGMNLLILKEKDVKIITDLMMGGDGTNVSDELTDLHLSAISEAMNQMVGSSSTSLSEMLGEKIDINPPEALNEQLDAEKASEMGLDSQETVAITSFKMTIGDLIDSEIMQIMPIDVARQLVEKLMTPEEEDMAPEPEVVNEPEVQETPEPEPRPVAENTSNQNVVSQSQPQVNQVQQQPQRPKVNAQPLEFNNFSDNQDSKYYNNDIELIKEVPLEITVELGRTTKKISEILEVGEGSVLELNSIVGESLNILANGQMIAKGEVVVVDENYGVRVTDIITPEKIIERI